jgi:raffinose/stachyose/melibiose transport system permease protein
MKGDFMHYSNTNKFYPILFLMPALVLFTAFFIIPNVVGLFMSFTDWSSYHPFNPGFIGWANFKDLFGSSIFITSIKNTIFFMIFTTVIKIVFGFLLALILNSRLKFKNIYRTIIFSPYVMNTIVIALVFNALYHPQNGPINVVLREIGLGFLAQNWLTDLNIAMISICLMDVWMGIGGTMIIFLAGLQSVPQEYYESATIDGAGGFHRFIHITFPLTIHSLTINTILSMVAGAKVFGQVYGLTNGGPADQTQVYGTFIFKSFSQGLFGYSAAAGLLFTVAICLISFTLLRLFRKLEVEY